MTREQLKAKFPNASEAFLDKNAPSFGYPRFHPPEETPVVKPAPKRIRQSSKPLLNKLETEYQDILLKKSPYANPKVYPQAIRFRLANGAWYKPDLVSWNYGNMRCFEVKGPKGMKGQPKGLMTLKVAAAQYPEVDWYLVWKESGQWQEQLVLP